MIALTDARVRELAFIWAAALGLFAAGVVALQRAYPETFAQARAQLAVERRELMWAAEGAQAPVQLACFGLLKPLHPNLKHEDLLEKASVGLR